jgi:hypothetical protein
MLPTMQQVNDYLTTQTQPVSSKDIAKNFQCTTKDINRSRTNYIGIYTNPDVISENFKHSIKAVTQPVPETPFPLAPTVPRVRRVPPPTVPRVRRVPSPPEPDDFRTELTQVLARRRSSISPIATPLEFGDGLEFDDEELFVTNLS